MSPPTRLERVLAVVGTALAWFPVAAMLLTALRYSLASGEFRLDVLMPAALFPLFVAGGALLTVVAFRTRCRRWQVARTAATGLAALLLSQLVAIASGMASGAAPTGWPFAVAVVLLFVYTAAVVLTGMAGVALTRELAASRVS